MTYIYDMAGGTEYTGDELGAPRPADAPAQGDTRLPPENHVELRLAHVENPTKATPAAHVVYDLEALIGSLKD